jgi:hypothetical protein
MHDLPPDLEQDLHHTAWLVDKIRHRDDYAQNIYAALCNTEWQRQDVWPMLKDQRWSCSWRHASAIVASVRGQGDYLDWYCSGSAYWVGDKDADPGWVPEGMVTEEVRQDLAKIGWCVIDKDPE